MEISSNTKTIKLSEEELVDAISQYLEFKHSIHGVVHRIEHLVGTRTEGHGLMEVDVPYQDGVKITIEVD